MKYLKKTGSRIYPELVFWSYLNFASVPFVSQYISMGNSTLIQQGGKADGERETRKDAR